MIIAARPAAQASANLSGKILVTNCYQNEAGILRLRFRTQR
jgi:hypothetical protein